MKKNKLIITAVVALILVTVIVITISAQTRNTACVEDGSCCTEQDVCTCN